MPAVDVAHERRIDVVAEHLLQRCRQRRHELRSDTDHMVLLRAQPCGDVLEDDTQTRPLRLVGTTAMPDAAGVEGDAPGGHHCVRQTIAVARASLRIPTMAAGYEAGRSVVDGEVVERPHRVEDDLRMGCRERVDAVVAMEHLRGFTGPDLNAGRRAQLALPDR